MKKRLLTGFGGGAVTCWGLKYIKYNQTKVRGDAWHFWYIVARAISTRPTVFDGHKLLIGGACNSNISLGMPIVLSAAKPLCLHKPMAFCSFLFGVSEPAFYICTPTAKPQQKRHSCFYELSHFQGGSPWSIFI